MAHFAFIAPPLPGHLNPLLVLAGTLASRGHRATFLHMPDAARMVTRPGVGFHAIGDATHPPDALDAWTARMADLNGPIGLRAMIAETAAQTDMIAREAPDALRTLGIDAIVAGRSTASLNGARSTTQTPSGKSGSRLCAIARPSRVLPEPPMPVRVSMRVSRSMSPHSRISFSRPMKRVRW